MDSALERGRNLVGSWVFCAALSCALAFGQANTATVTGTVNDPSGGAVPNAHIQAKNQSTGATTAAITNATGRFTLPYLPIGTYSITASATGFQGTSRTAVELTAAQVLDLPFTLQVGSLQETVTVSSGTEALSYDTADQHSVAGDKEVHNLPLARLDWTGLLALNNGVTQTGSSGSVSMNGLAPASFKLTVDGTEASSNPEQPTVGFYQAFNVINTVNTDAIAEVSITKGIAPASVSGSMSGNINIITRSGTNQFHGTAFEFNSLNDYNARNQFLPTNPRSTFNEFGGSVGGPIRHDKLFFFANYEAVRTSSFSALNATVPTPQFATQAIAAVPQFAQEFRVFPAPNQPYAAGAQTAQWIGARFLGQKDSNAVGRIDYYLNSSNWLSLRYTDSHPSKDMPRVIEENPRVSSGISDAYNIQFTHASPGLNAITRMAYIRTDIVRLDQAYSLGLDEVKFGGFDSTSSEDYQVRGGTYTFEENLSKTLGRHSIEFGGILQRLNDGRFDDTTTTFTYSALSDFLSNSPSQVVVNFPLFPFRIHMYQLGGFVQDTFRVTPSLTINAGIRYDYFTVPKERDGKFFNRNPGPLGPGTGSFRPASSIYDADWPNFAPRLGLAWALGSDRKTVVRVGSGLFYNPHTIFGGPVETVLDAANAPRRITYSKAQAAAQALTYPFDKIQLLNLLEASGAPVSLTTISPHFPNPYSIQWHAGVQRELPFGMLLDTAYVGNRAVHLNMTRMTNLPNRFTGAVADPRFGSFRWYDGSDASWYDSWQTSLTKMFAHGLNFGLHYTWAHNLSYGDGDITLQTVPQNPGNLRGEKGPTPYDIRHSFRANFLYAPEVARLFSWNGRIARNVLDGWQISGILSANTGLPANVTDGLSANSTDRPDVVPGADPYLSNYTGTLQYLNRAAFVLVPIVSTSGEAGRPGNLGRYALVAPGQWNLDLSAAKNFSITERLRMQLRGDAFNSLNHTNLTGLVTDASKSNFGQLTSATARSIQIGAKLIF